MEFFKEEDKNINGYVRACTSTSRVVGGLVRAVGGLVRADLRLE